MEYAGFAVKGRHTTLYTVKIEVIPQHLYFFKIEGVLQQHSQALGGVIVTPYI